MWRHWTLWQRNLQAAWVARRVFRIWQKLPLTSHCHCSEYLGKVVFICIATQHIYLLKDIMATLHAWLQWVHSTYYLHIASAQGPKVKREPLDGAVNTAEISIPSCCDLSSQKRLVLKVRLSALLWTRAAELASAPHWHLWAGRRNVPACQWWLLASSCLLSGKSNEPGEAVPSEKLIGMSQHCVVPVMLLETEKGSCIALLRG